MMQVKVKLFASLRDGRFKESDMEFGEESKVKDVIEQCDLPLDEVAITMVNGKDVDNDHQLHEGDTVSIFPPVGGG